MSPRKPLRAKTGSADSSSVTPFRVKGRRCPICKKPALSDHRPFCSKRCAQIDLGRWLGEVYRAESADDAMSDGEVWSETTLRDSTE